MKVWIKVRVDVVSDQELVPEEVAGPVTDAVFNALKDREDVGFDHQLGDVSLLVDYAELIDIDPTD